VIDEAQLTLSPATFAQVITDYEFGGQ